jgi:2-phosphoglycerate kinase
MRGILVQSLVSRGVPFDVALGTASEIRNRIGRRSEVELADLAKLVEELLADHVDLEALPLRPLQEPPLVVSPRGSSNPFSKGMLAVSLQGAGLDPSDAYDVARELEARLLRENRRSIERSELRDRASETIERSHGPRAAGRYRIWRQALEDGLPIFLLIGGSTGAGKTSIAAEVARRLEISRVIGTDSIRQIMRLMFSPDLMPEIHCSTYDAHEALNLEHGGGPEAVIAAFREQAQKIVVGVHALLDRAAEENTSTIVEGVNLLPGILDLDRYRENAHVIFLVVATLDQAAYRNRFPTRAETARDRASERYLRHLDAILAIQDHILTEADHAGLPIIDNVQLDAAVLSVTRSVISTLKKSMPLVLSDEGQSV